MHKIIFFTLYGSETLSVALMEKCILLMYEKNVLKKISYLGPRRNDQMNYLWYYRTRNLIIFANHQYHYNNEINKAIMR
jgi:hypothetical protein